LPADQPLAEKPHHGVVGRNHRAILADNKQAVIEHAAKLGKRAISNLSLVTCGPAIGNRIHVGDLVFRGVHLKLVMVTMLVSSIHLPAMKTGGTAAN
jgi:hypothetical protein